MNFNFYLFGNPDNKYAQIPDDYLKEVVEPFQNKLQSTQIVIHRKDNLIHYIFSQKIHDTGYIGFCIIFNGSYIANIHNFLNFCTRTVEKYLVIEGNIISYDDNGNRVFLVDTLENSREITNRLKSAFNVWLDDNAIIGNLTTEYDGLNSYAECDDSTSEDKIEQLCEKYNTLVLRCATTLDDSYVGKIISLLRTKYVDASNLVEQLRNENARLLRKKKQFTFIIILFIAILLLVAVSFSINNSLSRAKENITSLKNSITVKNATISSLNNKVDSLFIMLNHEREACAQANDSLNHMKSIIADNQPFIVKSTDIDWDTGYLTIKYEGLVDQDLMLTVKSCSDDGYQRRSNSEEKHISKGPNETSIYVSSGLDRSRYHTFTLMVNNAIVGGGRH